MLRVIGGILQRVKRSYDIAGIVDEKDRLAGKTAEGDEFGITFFGNTELPPELLRQRIEEELKLITDIPGLEAIGVSMGIAKFDSQSDKNMKAEDLIEQADIAMSHAKLIKGQKVKFVEYTTGMPHVKSTSR